MRPRFRGFKAASQRRLAYVRLTELRN